MNDVLQKRLGVMDASASHWRRRQQPDDHRLLAGRARAVVQGGILRRARGRIRGCRANAQPTIDAVPLYSKRGNDPFIIVQI